MSLESQREELEERHRRHERISELIKLTSTDAITPEEQDELLDLIDKQIQKDLGLGRCPHCGRPLPVV